MERSKKQQWVFASYQQPCLVMLDPKTIIENHSYPCDQKVDLFMHSGADLTQAFGRLCCTVSHLCRGYPGTAGVAFVGGCVGMVILGTFQKACGYSF